jgi:two-component system, LytTR family, response regulator
VKLRIAIVDDEPLARSLLRRMLEVYPDVEVVAEYGNGADALRGLPDDQVALALLDIQMPGLSGLQLAADLLESESAPSIVFVTAFDEFAIGAFEVHAVDYLLKPVNPDRLQRALERVRARLTPERGDEMERLKRMLDMHSSRERRVERIAIRVGERTYLQRVEEIEWVEADGKYVKIHVGGKTYAMRETMKSMEARLQDFRFIRISRSAIVNLDRVRVIQPWFKGDLVLIMESGAEVTTTRGFREDLRELLDRRN